MKKFPVLFISFFYRRGNRKKEEKDCAFSLFSDSTPVSEKEKEEKGRRERKERVIRSKIDASDTLS